MQGDDGRTYDRFRNRLMIPIARETGSVIAFGGRALAADQQPKYLNSPETPLYTKGRTLYGLHLTKQAVREVGYVILVEGYFDLAQAVQAGVRPVVATCGTALTDRHGRLLRRFCSRTLLSFDPDSAGEGAAARSGELLLAQGFQVNVVQLPPGDDPDGYIRRHGADAYRERLRTSRPYLDDVLERAAAGRDVSRSQERRALLDRMSVAAIRIVSRRFVDRVSIAAGRGIFGDLAQPRRRIGDIVRQTVCPKGLIWVLMHEPAAAQSVLSGLEPADLEGLQTTRILRTARSLATVPAEGVPETLRERLEEEDAHLVRTIEQETVAAADVEDCGIELRKRRYDREREALQEEIDRRQQDGTPGALDEIDDLWARKKALLQRMEELAG